MSTRIGMGVKNKEIATDKGLKAKIAELEKPSNK